MDDYIKVFKKDKKGLAGTSKIIGQIGVGLIVASMLYFNENVYIKTKVSDVPTTFNAANQAEQSRYLERRKITEDNHSFCQRQ
jgi:phospho-N-acetylmuramoyl-pentapeptide-transferase